MPNQPSLAIVWFRNDLRIHDNALLSHPDVLNAKHLVFVHIFDSLNHFDVVSPWVESDGDHHDDDHPGESEIQISKWSRAGEIQISKWSRAGLLRKKFLIESLTDLSSSLKRRYNQELLVFTNGGPCIGVEESDDETQKTKTVLKSQTREKTTSTKLKLANGRPLTKPTGAAEIFPRVIDKFLAKSEESEDSAEPDEILLCFQAEDTHEEQHLEEKVLDAISKHNKLKATNSNLCQRKLNYRFRTVTTHFQSLLLREDLAFDPVKDLPLPFGKFFHEHAKITEIRKPLPEPTKLPPSFHAGDIFNFGAMSGSEILLDLSDLLKKTEAQLDEQSGVLGRLVSKHDIDPSMSFNRFVGGESEGVARVRGYCEITEKDSNLTKSFLPKTSISHYNRTRNFLDKAGSYLSPWLALGCISPRLVYHTALSSDIVKNDWNHPGFFKIFFELCWRDYFRFYCARFGSKIFFKSGPAGNPPENLKNPGSAEKNHRIKMIKDRAKSWTRNPKLEDRWRSGTLKKEEDPSNLVNCIMTELYSTGWISNRARYIVSFYLIHKANIDWRVGADWFEHCLLDHDPCSNYGEWGSMANICCADFPLGLKGRGPRPGGPQGKITKAGKPWAIRGGKNDTVGKENAEFEPADQALQYDKDGAYRKMWDKVRERALSLNKLDAGTFWTGSEIPSEPKESSEPKAVKTLFEPKAVGAPSPGSFSPPVRLSPAPKANLSCESEEPLMQQSPGERKEETGRGNTGKLEERLEAVEKKRKKRWGNSKKDSAKNCL